MPRGRGLTACVLDQEGRVRRETDNTLSLGCALVFLCCLDSLRSYCLDAGLRAA